MTIAICDDDRIFRNKVSKLIKDYFDAEARKAVEVIEFETGDELDKFDGWVDIAFVDVEMGVKSGIHASQHLKQRNSKVIIIVITAFDFYLDEALKYQVFRYMTKPLSRERFNRNFKDALLQYYIQTKKIVIETKKDNYTIDACNIIMIETRIGKVYIYTVESTYESIYNLRYWASRLADEPSFFQSHKSFIVNFDHIKRFTKNLIYLDNNCRAYLTARKFADFKHQYFMYLDCLCHCDI
ncbi:MAG: LytR/AlgR family response regulator transcription factor [Wujia sp.]